MEIKPDAVGGRRLMSDITPSSEHQKLMAILSDMAKVASALHVEPFPIYFLGGSACLPAFRERYNV